MKQLKLLANKKSQHAMCWPLMFGRYPYLAVRIPNRSIFPSFGPPVNKVQQSTTISNRSPIRCESIGLIAPEYHQSISIVTVIKGLTPRTGRQSKRNRQDMGTPITALFTVQERAVEPFKKSFINKLSTGLSTWK